MSDDDKVVTLKIPKKPQPLSTGWVDVTRDAVKLDVPADTILDAAKGLLKTAIIVGENKEGYITVLFSHASRAEANLLLDEAKSWLLKN